MCFFVNINVHCCFISFTGVKNWYKCLASNHVSKFAVNCYILLQISTGLWRWLIAQDHMQSLCGQTGKLLWLPGVLCQCRSYVGELFHISSLLRWFHTWRKGNYCSSIVFKFSSCHLEVDLNCYEYLYTHFM